MATKNMYTTICRDDCCRGSEQNMYRNLSKIHSWALNNLESQISESCKRMNGQVKVYTKFTKSLHQTAFST